jgi:hypothetical protein
VNRRYFFRQLASGILAATAPALFLPKLTKPGWSKVPIDDAPETVAAVDAAQEGTEMSVLMSFRVTGATKELLENEGVEVVRPMMLRYKITPAGVVKTLGIADEEVLKSVPVTRYSLGKSAWSKEEMGVEIQMISNVPEGMMANEIVVETLKDKPDECPAV